MKYFYISYVFEGGFGSTFCACPIYPEIREVEKNLGAAKVTILNIIELSKKQYKAQNIKDK